MATIVKSKSNIKTNRVIGPIGGGSAIGDIELIQGSQAKASGEKPKGHIGGNSGNARIASSNNGTFTISDGLENINTNARNKGDGKPHLSGNSGNARIASNNNGTFTISDGLENTSTGYVIKGQKGHISGGSGNARIASNNNGTFTLSNNLENTPTPAQGSQKDKKGKGHIGGNNGNGRIASNNNGTFTISDGLENTPTPAERKIGRAVKSEIKNASGAFGGGRIASSNNGTFTISDGLENTSTPTERKIGRAEGRKVKSEVKNARIASSNNGTFTISDGLENTPTPNTLRKGQNEVVLSQPPLASARGKVDALTIKQNSRLVGLPGSNSALGTTTVGPTGNTTINNTGIVFSNTKFNRSLNLENRLQQPATAGSTSNLAQYFLSDTYTKYLRITPFGIFTHTSPVTIAEWIFVPIQGGLEPEPFEFNSLFYQGVIIKNGELVSVSPTYTPRENIITLQGAVPYGGGFISIIGAQITTPVQDIQQSGNVQVQLPKSIESIGLNQGIIQQPNGGLGSATNISIPDPEIDTIEAPPRHGITEVKPFNFQPNVVGVTPQVLRYSGDRALAYFAPRVKHGSVFVGKLANYYDMEPGTTQIRTKKDFRAKDASDGSYIIRPSFHDDYTILPANYYDNQTD